MIDGQMGTSPNRAEPEPLLSNRLVRMLVLRGLGWAPERIGSQYGVKGATVTAYLREVRKRLGVDTLEQALDEAARLGFIASWPLPELPDHGASED